MTALQRYSNEEFTCNSVSIIFVLSIALQKKQAETGISVLLYIILLQQAIYQWQT